MTPELDGDGKAIHIDRDAVAGGLVAMPAPFKYAEAQTFEDDPVNMETGAKLDHEMSIAEHRSIDHGMMHSVRWTPTLISLMSILRRSLCSADLEILRRLYVDVVVPLSIASVCHHSASSS